MDPRTIELPIAEVTVLEDRAVVTRRGVVSLDGAPLHVADVASTIVDKTLSVRASGEARVAQARVHRMPAEASGAQSGDQQALRSVVDELRDRAGVASLELEAAGNAVASLQSIESLQLAELADDIALGRDVAERMSVLGHVRTRMHEALDERQRCARVVAEAQQDLERAEHRYNIADSQPRSLVARLELQIHGRGEAELTVRYSVAGALWRPAHVASLSEEGTVHIESQACVWQATGEDWTAAQLSFSTERPSLGTTAPQLETDELTLKAKERAVEVQTRDEVIATTGEGAAEIRDEMPGVDDGGEPLALRSAEARTVLANGKPHRVPLFSFEAEAQRELLCRAEKVPAVLVRTTQAHRGEHPLLAGPVELRRNGGYVGRTSTLFVAPGEVFELGWGPEPNLRVHRKEKPAEHTRKPLSAWVRKPKTVEITISNIGPRPQSIRVQERVVVSEIDKVEVEHGNLAGGTIDSDGILTKSLDVRGFGEATYAFDWTLVVHDDVRGL